jgi:hypothetical protein
MYVEIGLARYKHKNTFKLWLNLYARENYNKFKYFTTLNKKQVARNPIFAHKFVFSTVL